MHNGKRSFEEVKDDDSAQFSSSLMNSHNMSPVMCLPPDPHKPPLMYRPQSINTPMWNGKAEMYDAWKASLIPALAQLGYSDLLVTGNPNDPAIKVYVRANPEWDSSLSLHIQQAFSAGHTRTLCDCHRSTKSGNLLLHAICEQEEHGANIVHHANAARKQLHDLRLTPSKEINEFINDFRRYSQILDDLKQNFTPEALCQMILDATDDPDMESAKGILHLQDNTNVEQLFGQLKTLYLNVKQAKGTSSTSRSMTMVQPPYVEKGQGGGGGGGRICDAIRDAFHFPDEMWKTFSPEVRQTLLKHKSEAIANAEKPAYKGSRCGGKNRDRGHHDRDQGRNNGGRANRTSHRGGASSPAEGDKKGTPKPGKSPLSDDMTETELLPKPQCKPEQIVRFSSFDDVEDDDELDLEDVSLLPVQLPLAAPVSTTPRRTSVLRYASDSPSCNSFSTLTSLCTT